MEKTENKIKAPSQLRNCKGSLSITALWMLALLSLLGLGVMRNVLMGLKLENYATRSAEAAWLARAGVYHAISVLTIQAAADSLQSFDALTQPWAHDPERFAQVACGQGVFEVSYPNPTSDPELSRIYGMVDENRKINLNRASREWLLRLPGMTAAKVAALLDWRDDDDQVRKDGAEATYYKQLEHPHSCKNSNFEFVEELTLVRDFTEEDLRNLSELITVHGDGQININTASEKVLEIMGLDPELARKIVRFRSGSDGQPFTSDDVVFQKVDDIVKQLTDALKLKPSDQALLNQLVTEQNLGVRSSHFTIESTGMSMNGQVRRKVTAVVHRVNAKRVDVIHWTEPRHLK